MENIKILLDGVQKDVYGLFYIYDSKYYFIYTEKEIDENDYVILYMVQVGKETKNTENGPVDTGYMVGVEVTDPNEQTKIQTSISYIVEDKKNNTVNPQIQYLPISMLSNLKIISKKRFRLLKSIMIDNFKLEFEGEVPRIERVINKPASMQPLNNLDQNLVNSTAITPQDSELDVENKYDINNADANDSNVIVDYRSKFFEEEEKNRELQAQIEELTKKINEIKKIIE